MRPSWTLDDEEYLGANFRPGRKEIHVLVEVPEAAAGVASGSQDMKELIEMSMSKVLDEREEKRSVLLAIRFKFRASSAGYEEDATTRRLPRFLTNQSILLLRDISGFRMLPRAK